METHGLEMAGPFRSGDGVDAIQIASGTGNVTILTDAEIDGDAQLDGTVKFTSGSPADGKVIVATDSNGTCSWAFASVPATEIFLFESNVQITGYTLLTGVDGAVAYITEGTPGGEIAGSYKSGGTWTQPTHEHGGLGAYTGSHQLSLAELPSHRHSMVPGHSFLTDLSGGNSESHAQRYRDAYTDYQGSDGTHRHDLSGMTADGTPNTWRPYGRNMTRQRKN